MILALLLACRNPTETSVTPTSTDPAELCADALALGDTEGTVTWSNTFTWSWSDDLQTSAGPVVALALPPDLSSFSISVDAAGEYTGIGLLELDGQAWLDGTLYEGEGAWDTAPYYHWGTSGGTVSAPITPATDPSGASCLRVQAAALDDRTGDEATLWVTIRNGTPTEPVIDLNVVLVGGTTLSQQELDATRAVVERVWTAGGGPTIGETTTWSVEGEALLTYADSTELRRTVVGDATAALNLFLIADYLDESGTLGEAGGIPGPLVSGMDEAGVIVALDPHRWFDGSLDTDLLGSTIAHEVGHQLGLFHPTESDGTRTESLDDTPACPSDADTDGDGSWSAEECEAWDGANFMFWTSGSIVQEEASAQQGYVIAHAPVVH